MVVSVWVANPYDFLKDIKNLDMGHTKDNIINIVRGIRVHVKIYLEGNCDIANIGSSADWYYKLRLQILLSLYNNLDVNAVLFSNTTNIIPLYFFCYILYEYSVISVHFSQCTFSSDVYCLSIITFPLFVFLQYHGCQCSVIRLLSISILLFILFLKCCG